MAKEEMNFEESLQKLEAIVKELESGNVDLDVAINNVLPKALLNSGKLVKIYLNHLSPAHSDPQIPFL